MSDWRTSGTCQTELLTERHLCGQQSRESRDCVRNKLDAEHSKCWNSLDRRADFNELTMGRFLQIVNAATGVPSTAAGKRPAESAASRHVPQSFRNHRSLLNGPNSAVQTHGTSESAGSQVQTSVNCHRHQNASWATVGKVNLTDFIAGEVSSQFEVILKKFVAAPTHNGTRRV